MHPHPPPLDLFNPLTPLVIGAMLVVGFVLGLGLRWARLHRDATPGMITAYVFAAVVAYTLTWRGIASITLHRDLLQTERGYTFLAIVYCLGIYGGKWLVSRMIHRRRNRQTGPRLRRQLEERRRQRAADAADQETLRRLQRDAEHGKDAGG